MRFFYGSSSREGLDHLYIIIISLGTKFDIIFVIVSLKTESCSLTSKLMSADSTALFYDQGLLGKNTFKSNFIRWWQWG